MPSTVLHLRWSNQVKIVARSLCLLALPAPLITSLSQLLQLGDPGEMSDREECQLIANAVEVVKTQGVLKQGGPSPVIDLVSSSYLSD